jgi:hypothetical protein
MRIRAPADVPGLMRERIARVLAVAPCSSPTTPADYPRSSICCGNCGGTLPDNLRRDRPHSCRHRQWPIAQLPFGSIVLQRRQFGRDADNRMTTKNDVIEIAVREGVHKAGHAASETVQRAEHVASDAAQKVKDIAGK